MYFSLKKFLSLSKSEHNSTDRFKGPFLNYLHFCLFSRKQISLFLLCHSTVNSSINQKWNGGNIIVLKSQAFTM